MSRKRQVFEAQADVIEAVLSKHSIQARVTGGAELPRYVRFDLSTVMGEKISRIRGLAEEMALAMGARSARVIRSDQGLAVQVPREDPRVVSLPAILRQVDNPGAGVIALGLADDGQPLMLKLDSPQVAHALVAGTTGSGKSGLLRSMIMSLCHYSDPGEVSLVLLDPKGGREFAMFAQLPHVASLVTDPEACVQQLQGLVQVMEDRDLQRVNRPLVVVFIDELADLLMVAGRPAVHAVTRLTQRGRSAGIHVIAATQKPTAEVLGSLTKANFPIRLVGRVTSPEEAKVASGYAGTGAENLQPPGEFVVIHAGQLVSFTAAYIAPTQILDKVAQLAQLAPTSSLIIPEPQIPPDQDPLDQYIEAGRPVWLVWRDGSGGLKRGGQIQLARAIFGPEATGAGHQHKWIKRVIEALESDALEDATPQAGGSQPVRAKTPTLGRPLEGQAPGEGRSHGRPGMGRVSLPASAGPTQNSTPESVPGPGPDPQGQVPDQQGEDLEAGEVETPKRPLDVTTTGSRLFLRPKGADWRGRSVVVRISEGRIQAVTGSLGEVMQALDGGRLYVQ